MIAGANPIPLRFRQWENTPMHNGVAEPYRAASVSERTALYKSAP
jgi:hypothetical protein